MASLVNAGLVLLEQLVDEEAACIQGFDRTGLRASHALMNKFRGPEDTNFKLVSSCLRDFIRNASRPMDDQNDPDLGMFFLLFDCAHLVGTLFNV